MDLPHTVWSDSICNNLLRLLHLDNVVIAVGISFLSALEAKLWVFPVIGRHNGFATSGLVGHYLH